MWLIERKHCGDLTAVCVFGVIAVGVAHAAYSQTAEGPIEASRNAARLVQLEEEIRQLQGRIEKLEFENTRLERMIQSEIANIEDRLNRIDPSSDLVVDEAPEISPTIDAAGRNDNAGSTAQSQIPSNVLLGGRAEPDAEPSDRPELSFAETPDRAYERALASVRARDWPAAQAELEEFLQTYPDGELAPASAYWLGETHFVRNDFQAAAATFARNYRVYGPTAPRAADNLLKLAISLVRLGDFQRACQAFDRLDAEHQDAGPPIRQAVARERQAAGC